MPQFTLDARIEADSLAVTDLPLSAVRLMRDANYPWLVLVPRRAGLVEILDLNPDERTTFMAEIAHAAEVLRQAVRCDKLNWAALGNMVRQLHAHVIARRTDDPAWPRPVWGAAAAKSYAPGAAESLAAVLRARLQ